MTQASVTVSGAQVGTRIAGRGAVFGAAFWLAVSWLACGGASSDGLESPLVAVTGGAGVGNTPDAGSTSDAVVECPPPFKTNAESLGPATAWARNPDTGTCCPYADQVYVPEVFPSFESLEACETSCRCSDLIPGSLERISLECYCTEKTCPESFEAIAEERCNLGRTLRRSEGCGLRRLELVQELGVTELWVFDQATGALVGAADASDARSYPCSTFGTDAGQGFDCPQAELCQLCGELELDANVTTPPCE